MRHSDHLVLRGTTTQQGGLGESTGGPGPCPWVGPVLVPIGKVLGKPLHPSASLCNAFAFFTQQGRPGHQLRPGLTARKAPGRLVLGTFECHTPLVGCEDGVSCLSLVPQMWSPLHHTAVPEKGSADLQTVKGCGVPGAREEWFPRFPPPSGVGI